MRVNPEREQKLRTWAQELLAQQTTPLLKNDGSGSAELYVFRWNVDNIESPFVVLDTWVRDDRGIEVEGSRSNPNIPIWITRLALYSGDTEFRRDDALDFYDILACEMLTLRTKDFSAARGMEHRFEEHSGGVAPDPDTAQLLYRAN